MWHDFTMQPRAAASQPAKNRRGLAILLLWAFTTHGALAAAIGDDNRLNADSLVQQVQAQNAGLAALRAAVDAARARIKPAGALPDAQLSGAVAPETIGGFRNPSGRERGVNVRFEISQELPWPGTLGLRADAARKDAAAASEDVAALRLRLAALTRSAYAEWAYTQQALALNTNNQDLVDELRRVAENRYATGLAHQQDVLQAEVQLQHLKHQAITLVRLQRATRAKINGLLNRSPVMPLPEAEPLAAPRPLPTYAELRDVALARHPELAQMRKRVAAGQDREAIANKAFYPNLKVFGGYNSLWDADEKRWIVGAGISLPLDRSKYRAHLDEAKANTMRSRFALEDARTQLLSELEQARAAVDESAYAITLYQQQLIPRTAENLSAARSEYGSGGGAFLDVITAEQLKLNAELELARARADYSIALAELQRWAGGSLPPTAAKQQVHP